MVFHSDGQKKLSWCVDLDNSSVGLDNLRDYLVNCKLICIMSYFLVNRIGDGFQWISGQCARGVPEILIWVTKQRNPTLPRRALPPTKTASQTLEGVSWQGAMISVISR